MSVNSGLRKALLDLTQNMPVYVAGGPVRDWLMGISPVDLDVVVPDHAISLAESLARSLNAPFIPLDRENGVARVVCDDLILDFSQFREKARSIEEDLSKRDFTINAMAVPLESVLDLFFDKLRIFDKDFKKDLASLRAHLIDPFHGQEDMANGMIIRAISKNNLMADPLRLLRAYRFKAQLGGLIERETLSWIKELFPMIIASSAERISHELEIIMGTERAAGTFLDMLDSRLLFKIIPELSQAEGVEQPGFHHLDVLGHSLEALNTMETLIKDPGLKFHLSRPIIEWLGSKPHNTCALKWSALFHDLGKPLCKGMKKGRTTFYHHDRKGAELVEKIAARLRWSGALTQFVSRMVRLHMRPFHLLNDLRAGGPTKRAMRRLILEVKEDYPGLFLLSMADSMAGCGPLKPEGLDDELSILWERVHYFYIKEFMPLKAKKRFLTGNDIQKIFGLSPGPLIGKALDALEDARVEGQVRTRREAIAWMGEWISQI